MEGKAQGEDEGGGPSFLKAMFSSSLSLFSLLFLLLADMGAKGFNGLGILSQKDLSTKHICPVYSITSYTEGLFIIGPLVL